MFPEWGSLRVTVEPCTSSDDTDCVFGDLLSRFQKVLAQDRRLLQLSTPSGNPAGTLAKTTDRACVH
jgi:hypothetical protein